MRELDKRLNAAFKALSFKPGDIYESCSHHPVLCLGVDYKVDEIWGISLIDGSYPRSCSLLHCGVRKLTPKQTWELKTRGPLELHAHEQIQGKHRWWNARTEATTLRVRLSGPRKLNTSAPPTRAPVKKSSK